MISGNLPVQPLTWEQFVASQRHRSISIETLRVRFDVADANDDGLLTSREIEAHRISAARNKGRDG